MNKKKAKNIFIIIIVIISANIYTFIFCNTNVIKYLLYIEFYHNVRYSSNYPVSCFLNNNKEDKEIQIMLSGININHMSYSDRYSSYYEITQAISNYFKKNNEKFENYKISIEFSTISNINNMYLYNYNVDTGVFYDNIYDFNYMELGFPVYYENNYIIEQNIFSNIQDLYIDSMFTSPSNKEESVYFVQTMDNLKTIKSDINLKDTGNKEWLNYIKKEYPNCEIIYTK